MGDRAVAHGRMFVPGRPVPHFDHARRVADAFHVVRVGYRCLDKVRRRVQNETVGHRGRKPEPRIGSASCWE